MYFRALCSVSHQTKWNTYIMVYYSVCHSSHFTQGLLATLWHHHRLWHFSANVLLGGDMTLNTSKYGTVNWQCIIIVIISFISVFVSISSILYYSISSEKSLIDLVRTCSQPAGVARTHTHTYVSPSADHLISCRLFHTFSHYYTLLTHRYRIRRFLAAQLS